MTMTTQELTDWAFAQNVSAKMKMALLALAWGADPSGGGRVTLAVLEQRTCMSVARILKILGRLQSAGLLIFQQPNEFEIVFGLCIDRRPS